jgi:SAM-dependent methyltransferase
LVGESYLADPQLRREYDSEIAPRTVAALESVFAGATIAVPSRVLDLGAGTGAAAKAIRARFASAEIVSVDKVSGPGILRADVTRSVRPLGVEGRFDLIVAAHLLNELPLDMDGRARLVAGWCRDLLQPDGTCILVEPALRATSRELLAVRDRLIAAGLFVVAAGALSGTRTRARFLPRQCAGHRRGLFARRLQLPGLAQAWRTLHGPFALSHR